MSATVAGTTSTSALAERWPDVAEAARTLPPRLREAISGLESSAWILLVGASDRAWPRLLGNLASGSHVETMAPDPSEGRISFEGARQGGADWDLIVDAGASTNHRRIDLLLALLPRLKPNGLYLLIDPTAVTRGRQAGQDGDLLKLLYTLSDMINGRRLPATDSPAVDSPEFKAQKIVPAADLHNRVQSLVGSIEIVSSGAILRRAAASPDAPPHSLELSLADLHPYLGSSDADGQCAQRIAALSAELQRLSSFSARQSADIAALERERVRLANRRLLRLAALSGNVTGAPLSIKQKAAHLARAVLRRALAIPRVRTLAHKLRSQLLR